MRVFSAKTELTALVCLSLCIIVPPAFFVCWPWLSWTRLRGWMADAPEPDLFTRIAKAVPLAVASGLLSLASTFSATLAGCLLWSGFLTIWRNP